MKMPVPSVYYVDIDNTICTTVGVDYENATPRYDQIAKINKLFDEGHTIVMYTARGSGTPANQRRVVRLLTITESQLQDWGVKYHRLDLGNKPPFDVLIDDRSMRIEELE